MHSGWIHSSRTLDSSEPGGGNESSRLFIKRRASSPETPAAVGARAHTVTLTFALQAQEDDLL
ncbi:hypothetical protein FQA47_001908 [Oryzias melastigma]|uniref:Uncharacterized protein n=1 Tax=Oryzias melastigma TaxID=30732 RepID=A0A834KWB7_ORYME|nr:hypothetical protein FQA47_001908 [Oryzias melastigma]